MSYAQSTLFTAAYIMIVQNATVFTERVNTSCTPASTPNILIKPSQTVTMMDESSSRDKYAMTLIWVVLSLVGLLLFLAIIVVVGIIRYVRKKTKKQKLAEFAKSRSAKFKFSLSWNNELSNDCSEEGDFDIPTRYTSTGKQTHVLS